ncbi:MAG: hypothetical protein WAT66_12120 [Actinomycetota bacterium]
MRARRTPGFHPPTPKWGIAVTAALLVLAGGVARAQEQPPDKPTSAPGSEPGIEPIAAGSIEVEGTALSAGGKTVESAPAGENVTVVITLRNNLEAAAKNVHVHAEQPPQGMRIIDADASVGDLALGASDTARIGVVVAKDGCTDFAGFGGEITYDGGTAPLKVSFPVACPGPRLSLENVIFSGGDGDGVPEPGETVRATIVLRNDGRDPATGLRARVTIAGDKVSTQNDDLAWADIDPRESARSASPLTLVIDDGAPRQKGCEGVSILPAPVEDQGNVPPDTAVSSDGTVSSQPATASDLPASSEPGAAGGGEPGSSGSGTPTVVEPEPGTATPEPLPATVEPVPAPGTIEPQPEPAPADQPAEIALKLSVTASGYETTLEYSNQTFCALEGRAVTDTRAAAPMASRDGSTGSTGGAAIPVLIAVLASALAVGGRRALAS